MPFGKKVLDSILQVPSKIGTKEPPTLQPHQVNGSRNLSDGPKHKSSTKHLKHTTRRSIDGNGSKATDEPHNDGKNASPKNYDIEHKRSETGDPTNGVKSCAECHATETSTWRRNPLGEIICNKCGLRKRRDHRTSGRRSISTPKKESVSGTAQALISLPKIEAEHDVVQIPAEDQGDLHPSLKSENQGDLHPSLRFEDTEDFKFPDATQVPRTPPEDHVMPFCTRRTDAKISVRSDTHPSTSDLTAAERPIMSKDLPGVIVSPITHMASPDRRMGYKKPAYPPTLEAKVCQSCETHESPAWRKDKNGNPLCNRCMLRQKRAAARKPGTRRWKRKSTTTGTDGHHVADESASQAGEHDRTSSSGSEEDVEQNLSAGQSKGAYRTDSQVAYDKFTHLNSSSFLSEGTMDVDSTTIPHKPASPQTATRSTKRRSLPTFKALASAKQSTVGQPAPNKSTAMVSRADTRTLAAPKKDVASSLEMNPKPLVPSTTTTTDFNSRARKSRDSDVIEPSKRQKTKSPPLHNDVLVKQEKGSDESALTQGLPSLACIQCLADLATSGESSTEAQRLCANCLIKDSPHHETPTAKRRKPSSRGPTGPSPLVLRTRKKRDDAQILPTPSTAASDVGSELVASDSATQPDEVLPMVELPSEADELEQKNGGNKTNESLGMTNLPLETDSKIETGRRLGTDIKKQRKEQSLQEQDKTLDMLAPMISPSPDLDPSARE